MDLFCAVQVAEIADGVTPIETGRLSGCSPPQVCNQSPYLADAAYREGRRILIVPEQVAIGPITAADHEAGTGAIKAFADGYGASSINVDIKAGRGKGNSLRINSVWSTINSLLGRIDETAITQLKVKGREHDDNPYEIIDLLQHREKRDRMLPVDQVTRRVYHTARWNALIEIRRDFLQNVGQN